MLVSTLATALSKGISEPSCKTNTKSQSETPRVCVPHTLRSQPFKSKDTPKRLTLSRIGIYRGQTILQSRGSPTVSAPCVLLQPLLPPSALRSRDFLCLSILGKLAERWPSAELRLARGETSPSPRFSSSHFHQTLN